MIELRPGLFLNPIQFIGVRMLPREDEGAFAVLTLSNGDKLNITRDEFATITGAEPDRAAARPSQEIKGALKPVPRSQTSAAES